MSTAGAAQTYGLSRDQAWRMLPQWARRELELRHDGFIPLASMIDALSWPAPPARTDREEELRWIAVYGSSARRSVRHCVRLIRREPRHLDFYLSYLRDLRAEHSQLMARRGYLLRVGNAGQAVSPVATCYAAA